MADIYLSSVDGDNADDGSTWALAKATLAAALTAAGAGGRVFVDHSHAETQATNMTLASPGTAASPVQVLCVDRIGNPEPPTALATTATVSATGNVLIDFSGVAFVYGITFSVGTGATQTLFRWVSASRWWWRFVACSLRKPATIGTTSMLSVGVVSTAGGRADCGLELINTTVHFGSTGDGIKARCPFIWKNTASAIGGTTPTTLFHADTNASDSKVLVQGVDLSALGSGNNLVSVSDAVSSAFRFENCKLGTSVAITTGTNPGQTANTVELVNCDSADTNYRYRKACYQGDIYHETTIVLAASDGTTTFSRKMVSSANSKLYSPLVFEGPLVWNETVGSAVTATIEVVTDNVTLTDKEAWLEIEYMGTSGFPLSLFADDRASDDNAFLGSGTNQTTSSASWTTTGLTTPVKQKFAVTFTPQEKGWIRGRVMLAKASTTMYVDPLMTLS